MHLSFKFHSRYTGRYTWCYYECYLQEFVWFIEIFRNTLKGLFKVSRHLLWACWITWPLRVGHFYSYQPGLPASTMSKLTHLWSQYNQVCSIGLNCSPFLDKFNFPFNQTMLITFVCPVSSLKKFQSNKSSKTTLEWTSMTYKMHLQNKAKHSTEEVLYRAWGCTNSLLRLLQTQPNC